MGGPQSRSGRGGVEKKSLPMPENEPYSLFTYRLSYIENPF